MKRVSFIAGNWKMNTTRSTAIELARGVVRGAMAGVEIGVAPPFVYLDAVGAAVAGSPVRLGAQDVYTEKNGAFTGEISTDMLKDLGVSFVLAGHSERRHVLHEEPKLVSLKAQTIFAAGLTLVHCVGETLAQRDANQTFDVVKTQLAELGAWITDPARLVIAYEPVWAIGTGRNATDAQAQEVHAFIRQTLATTYSPDLADKVRIQYGGSLKPDNALALLAKPDVDGGLIGGASLKADSFLAIAAAAVAAAK
jgi:triosephosphate isomerase